jgi:hypothetical protein
MNIYGGGKTELRLSRSTAVMGTAMAVAHKKIRIGNDFS